MLMSAKPVQQRAAVPAGHHVPAAPKGDFLSPRGGIMHAGLPRYLSSAAPGGSSQALGARRTGTAAPAAMVPRFLQGAHGLAQPGDGQEAGARHMAEQIVAMPGPSPRPVHGTAMRSGRLARRDNGDVGQYRQPIDAGPAKLAGLASVNYVAGIGSGQPLDSATKAYFEPRFGCDFGDVRLHTGPLAMQSAHAVDARAYTAGRDVVFGAGQFAPATGAGQRLLAHELTHVIQQSRSGPALQRAASTETAPADAPQPPDKLLENQPQNEPELNKVTPYWDRDTEAWVYADIQYREIAGTAVIGNISPRDVRQGQVGDCYLMAALISLAATQPGVIQRAISPDGPGRWKVRLYAKQKDGSFKANTYVIDNMFPASAAGGMAYAHSNQTGFKQVSLGSTYVDNRYNDPLFQGAIPADAEMKENFAEIPDADNRELWPAIIEKAYAMHAPAIGMVQQGKRSGGYDDIGQGDGSHTALEVMTGKPANATDMAMLAGDRLFQRIDAALRAGAPVTAGTPGSQKKRNEKLMLGSNLYGNHAYAVLALKGLDITLRNPWGRTYKDSDLEARPELQGKDDTGDITLTLEAFRRAFDTVYIGSSAVPVK